MPLRVSFKIALGFHVWVSPRVPLGYKQERIKQKKMENTEAIKTGSREAEGQEAERQNT